MGTYYEGLAKSATASASLIQQGTQTRTGQEPQFSEAEYQTTGTETGIIGLLEIALQDYKDMATEVEMSEATAEKDFKAMMSEVQIKTAAFKKDLEYKERFKVQYESDQMHARQDI